MRAVWPTERALPVTGCRYTTSQVTAERKRWVTCTHSSNVPVLKGMSRESGDPRTVMKMKPALLWQCFVLPKWKVLALQVRTNSSGCLEPSQMAFPTLSQVALAQEVRPRNGKGSRDNGGTIPSTHPSLAGGRMHPSSHTFIRYGDGPDTQPGVHVLIWTLNVCTFQCGELVWNSTTVTLPESCVIDVVGSAHFFSYEQLCVSLGAPFLPTIGKLGTRFLFPDPLFIYIFSMWEKESMESRDGHTPLVWYPSWKDLALGCVTFSAIKEYISNGGMSGHRGEGATHGQRAPAFTSQPLGTF